MPQKTLATALVLTLVLAGIGGADYWLRERPKYVQGQEQPEQIATNTGTGSAASQGMSSSRRVVKKGTRKMEIESVESILARTGFTLQETRESLLLALATPLGAKVKTGVLLYGNDRAALIGWADDPDVKSAFLDLKQALQRGFSPQARDVVDERVMPDDGTSFDMLSFTDPAISGEKIIVIRVRTLLVELHVAEGKDGVVEGLMKELTK